MPSSPSYTPITGLVIATADYHVLFNFGQGEEWVRRDYIREDTMFPGDIGTWHVLTDVLIQLGIAN